MTETILTEDNSVQVPNYRCKWKYLAEPVIKKKDVTVIVLLNNGLRIKRLPGALAKIMYDRSLVMTDK